MQKCCFCYLGCLICLLVDLKHTQISLPNILCQAEALSTEEQNRTVYVPSASRLWDAEKTYGLPAEHSQADPLHVEEHHSQQQLLHATEGVTLPHEQECTASMDEMEGAEPSAFAAVAYEGSEPDGTADFLGDQQISLTAVK